jgi:DNA-binding XRE family transcriptional regulator
MTSAYEAGAVPKIEVRHRLRIAREFAGLDQEALATRSGIARATISNAENGQGTPRRTTLNAWALACGVPVSWIITGDGSAGKPPIAPGPGPNGGPGGTRLPAGTTGLGIKRLDKAA